MKLLWMRHAEAESGAQMDPTRDLTDTGRTQAKMMGKWLKRQGHEPDALLQSNFTRSKETAKRVGKRLGLDPVTVGALDPDAQPADAWQAIKSTGAPCVLAVSHGPLVEGLLAYLTGGTLPQQFHFSHGAIAYLETTGGKRGVLHWLVTPNVVARDEDEMDAVTQSVAREALAIAEVAAGLL